MQYIEFGQRRYETPLVIFDKDGTLLDFTATWVNIIDELLAAIGRRLAMHDGLSRRMQASLGVSCQERRIDGGGPFAMGTDDEVYVLLAACLYQEGLRWDKAQAVVHEALAETFRGPVREKNLCAAPGAIELLRLLKSRGILTAVATNDNRTDATRDMEVIGALPYLDLVVGADSVTHTKPAPDMIHLICRELGQTPQHAVMIGDTMMDALMGRNAGVMLNIGISGIVPAEELATVAHAVIASLEEIR